MIKSKLSKNSNIYLVIQNSVGYDFWVMRYSLRPNQVNTKYDWSVGEPYYDGDIWTKNKSAQTFFNDLVVGEFDYVYLFKVDDKFKNKYGLLFDKEENIKNYALFRVNYDTMLLELVN